MNTPHAYRVRPAFAVAVAVDVALLIVLIGLSFTSGAFRLEQAVLCLITLPLIYLFVDALTRETSVTADGITIKKLFRTKMLPWNTVTNADMMLLGAKAYLLLTTTRGFHILPNSYGNFTALVKDIVARMDAEKVEDRVGGFIAHPARRMSDIISLWLAALVLLVVIALKIV